MLQSVGKTYLSDAVYAEFSMGQIKLTVESGAGADLIDEIILESEVFEALLKFGARCYEVEIIVKEIPGKF